MTHAVIPSTAGRELRLQKSESPSAPYVLLSARNAHECVTVTLNYAQLIELANACRTAASDLIPPGTREAGDKRSEPPLAQAPILSEAQRLQLADVIRAIAALQALIEDPGDGA